MEMYVNDSLVKETLQEADSKEAYEVEGLDICHKESRRLISFLQAMNKGQVHDSRVEKKKDIVEEIFQA